MRPRITKTKVAAYLLLILAVVLGVGLFVTQSRKDKGKEMKKPVAEVTAREQETEETEPAAVEEETKEEEEAVSEEEEEAEDQEDLTEDEEEAGQEETGGSDRGPPKRKTAPRGTAPEWRLLWQTPGSRGSAWDCASSVYSQIC